MNKEPIKGKSLEEIEPYREEKKGIYVKLLETILISSFNYLNDFSKFMIGLNSALLTSYFAILKIAEVRLDLFIIIPFLTQAITLLFFLATIFPRSEPEQAGTTNLIFDPDKIISIYQKSIAKKNKWAKAGTISFIIYLLSVINAAIQIISKN